MTVDIDNVVFTSHAVKRFKSRYKKVHGCILRRPENTARKLLMRALVDETMESRHRLNRLLNNQIVEASYYVRSDWRFVIIKEDNQSIVLTIERVK